MRRVARGADGSVHGASLNSAPVHTGVELLSDWGVTHGAYVEGRLAKGPRVRLRGLMSATVAKAAVRSRSVARLDCLAMCSGGVFTRFLRMARVAGRLRGPGRMRVVLVSRVASSAVDGGVRRKLEFLPLVVALSADRFAGALRPGGPRDRKQKHRKCKACVAEGSHSVHSYVISFTCKQRPLRRGSGQSAGGRSPAR